VYGTVYGYTVRYGNTAYSRIFTVLDRIYGKIRYGVRYGPNFAAAFKSALMLGGAAAALPQGLEFALHLFCWALAAAVEDRKPQILMFSRCSFMRALCADLTLGQCLHAYLTSIAAAAVVAAVAAAAGAAAGAGAAAASSSSAISWSPPAAAAPAAGTGRLSNCSHTQAFFLTLACF